MSAYQQQLFLPHYAPQKTLLCYSVMLPNIPYYASYLSLYWSLMFMSASWELKRKWAIARSCLTGLYCKHYWCNLLYYSGATYCMTLYNSLYTWSKQQDAYTSDWLCCGSRSLFEVTTLPQTSCSEGIPPWSTSWHMTPAIKCGLYGPQTKPLSTTMSWDSESPVEHLGWG